MSILQTVRTSTRSKHDLMENLIGSDRLSEFSIEDYILLLSTNFIFHSHLEEKVKEFLLEEEAQNEYKKEAQKEDKKNNKKNNKNKELENKWITKFDFDERIKAIVLEQELKNILPPSTFKEVKAIQNTVSFLDYHSLLGRVYVAEGSMLGGKMMQKILAQNEQINQVTNFDFFKSFEGTAFPLWKSFKELVEEECVTEKQQENFLNGAEKSYLYFEQSFYKAKNILQSK